LETALDHCEDVANLLKGVATKICLVSWFGLGIVIVVALLFDYLNGFHDTANAIATSVSTKALSPPTRSNGSCGV